MRSGAGQKRTGVDDDGSYRKGRRTTEATSSEITPPTPALNFAISDMSRRNVKGTYKRIARKRDGMLMVPSATPLTLAITSEVQTMYETHDVNGIMNMMEIVNPRNVGPS